MATTSSLHHTLHPMPHLTQTLCLVSHPLLSRPCPLSQSISCACGKTSYVLPCGAEAAAAPPRCNQKCPVPLLCRHAADAKPHRCHFGPCPPCRYGVEWVCFVC